MVNIFNKLLGYLDNVLAFPEDVEPKPSFTHALSEIAEFNKFIKNHACPNCNKKDTFAVTEYERGKNGFEARVVCVNCQTIGTVNTTGFQYNVKRVLRSSEK